MNRREFLRLGAAVAATGVVGSSLWQEALAAFPAMDGLGPYGPLGPPDANGLRLPAGFQSRLVATSGLPVAGTGYTWHTFPDGGATFPIRGGWIYVSNSEFIAIAGSGGAGAVRFDHLGNVVDAYRILAGTNLNCAGGATPWGTWLSCEETDTGYTWECDPSGQQPGVRRNALGRFKHEAAAVDPEFRHVYLTEDEGDGRLYRFAPDVWGDLASGLLEVARVDAAGDVAWIPVPEPDPPAPIANPTRHQVSDSTPFNRGEGIVWREGHVYFTTTGDDRVWELETASQQLRILYDRSLDPGDRLNGVDNITAARSGDLLVAEDHGGGEQELVLIAPDGVVSAFCELTGADQASSEITGPAFDPWGRRLYFSSQRAGALGIGLTYEVSGPFRQNATVGGCAGPV